MKNSISDSFNFESMNSDMLAEINSTISVSSTKDRQYKDLSDDVLIAMAISTGVKSSKELTQCLDNSFLSVLYEKDLMKKMFANKYVFGKRNYYNNLDEGKLLSIAYDLVEKNKLTKLTDIKSMDLPLYLCLLKKKLNSAVAKKYNFQFRSPKKNIKNYDAFSDDELFEKISAANIKTSTDLIKYDNKLYQELINRPSLRNRVILLGWRRKPQIWSSLSTDDWIKICSTFNSSIVTV